MGFTSIAESLTLAYSTGRLLPFLKELELCLSFIVVTSWIVVLFIILPYLVILGVYVVRNIKFLEYFFLS